MSSNLYSKKIIQVERLRGFSSFENGMDADRERISHLQKKYENFKKRYQARKQG